MTTRLDILIGDNYEIRRFSQLPASHQMAITWFMAVEGEAWDDVDLSEFGEDELKSAIKKLLPAYVQIYGDTLFGVATLNTASLQSAVMRDPEIEETFASWAEYHEDYLSGGVPEHPDSGRWPVLLSDHDEETLRDGWHRFHSYVRAGDIEVPAVFYPSEHHLKTFQWIQEDKNDAKLSGRNRR